MTGNTKVIAVLLHHNNLEGVLQVLNAVRQQSRLVDGVIVVDNGSDASVRAELQKQLDVHLLLQENRGVGAGHNAGWRYALEQLGADYIWSLEHDAEPFCDCLELLLAEAQHHAGKTWAFHPIEISGLDFANYTYFGLNSSGFHRVIDKTRLDNYFGGLSFNGLLLPRTTIEIVGYLREDFFVGMEDIDFYKRIYAHGGKCLRVTRSHVYHNGHKNKRQRRIGKYVLLLSKLSLQRDYYSTRNGYTLMLENGATEFQLRRHFVLSIVRTILLGPDRCRRLRIKWRAYQAAKMSKMGALDKPIEM